MITICLTHFKSLSLDNLRAALFSVRMQNLTGVASMIVFDNNSDDSREDIRKAIDDLNFPILVKLISEKHGDPLKTHAWSTNRVVREAWTQWVFFTRSDYILDFEFLQECQHQLLANSHDWNGFITGHVYHLMHPIEVCERSDWRVLGAQRLRGLMGVEETYTNIDSGVWCLNKRAFDTVGGLNEHLTAWGHAQTEFQYRLFKAGVEFKKLPWTLFYHPQHAAQRDINVAHRQLAEQGVSLKEMWSRYEGEQPY